MPQNLVERLEEVVDLGQRLGRHVEHDIRSADYAIEADLAQPLKTTIHERKLAILDQGNLGSCTGNAGTGLLGTEPFYSAIGHTLDLGEKFAVSLYSDASAADDFPGQYPPDDTGSSGLAIGRVLKRRKTIKSYQHAFGLLHGLQAFQKRPCIIGIPWLASMDDPGPNGVVKVNPQSGVRGGHEVEVIGIEVLNGDPNSPEGVVVCANSWSPSWGASGYFRIDFKGLDWLLKQQGDVMTFGLSS